MAMHVLRKVAPEENCYRHYRVSEQKLLFGGYDLILEWGRIGASTRVLLLPCKTLEEMDSKREAVLKLRHKHGYVSVIKK